MSRASTAAVLGIWAAAGLRVAGQKEQAAPKHTGAPVEIQMRNVNLRVAAGVLLQIRNVRGRLTPTTSEHPVTLDLRDSFVLDVDAGTMAMDTQSLGQLLNTYVFAYDGAPLKKLSLSTKGTRVIEKGTMHKGVDLPFELEGNVSATPDGAIKLHVDKLRTEHIPFKGLLHLFGEDLSKLININQARGVKLEGDDILMFPDRMLPPPHIHGRVTEVRVEGNNVVQVFRGDRESSPLRLPEAASNYIYHRGGVLRFGKLTMADADLEIIDANPKTPFDFSLMEYNRQLVAGYSKNTPAHGLIVHMPDFGQLASAAGK
jgi:hypothetical protein